MHQQGLRGISEMREREKKWAPRTQFNGFSGRGEPDAKPASAHPTLEENVQKSSR